MVNSRYFGVRIDCTRRVRLNWLQCLSHSLGMGGVTSTITWCWRSWLRTGLAIVGCIGVIISIASTVRGLGDNGLLM